MKKIIYFFTCISPNYVPYEITKEFWKNTHFETMTADFLLGCENTLGWNTPEKMHFQQSFFFIFTNMAHPIVIVLTKCSLWCIWRIFLLFFGPWHIQKITFAFKNQYFKDKSSLFLTEVNFDTSEQNQLLYFQNSLFFKILLSFHEPQYQVKYR